MNRRCLSAHKLASTCCGAGCACTIIKTAVIFLSHPHITHLFSYSGAWFSLPAEQQASDSHKEKTTLDAIQLGVLQTTNLFYKKFMVIKYLSKARVVGKTMFATSFLQTHFWKHIFESNYHTTSCTMPYYIMYDTSDQFYLQYCTDVSR